MRLTPDAQERFGDAPRGLSLPSDARSLAGPARVTSPRELG